MLGRQTKIVAIAAAGGVAAGIGLVVAVKHVKRRRRGRFLPKKARRAITEALELDARASMPGGAVANALWRRHINQASDRRLIALYAAAKAGEFMRDRGIDPMHVTPEQVEQVHERFAAVSRNANLSGQDTRTLLGGFDFAHVKPLLAAALAVLVLV